MMPKAPWPTNSQTHAIRSSQWIVPAARLAGSVTWSRKRSTVASAAIAAASALADIAVDSCALMTSSLSSQEGKHRLPLCLTFERGSSETAEGAEGAALGADLLSNGMDVIPL